MKEGEKLIILPVGGLQPKNRPRRFLDRIQERPTAEQYPKNVETIGPSVVNGEQPRAPGTNHVARLPLPQKSILILADSGSSPKTHLSSHEKLGVAQYKITPLFAALDGGHLVMLAITAGNTTQQGLGLALLLLPASLPLPRLSSSVSKPGSRGSESSCRPGPSPPVLPLLVEASAEKLASGRCFSGSNGSSLPAASSNSI